MIIPSLPSVAFNLFGFPIYWYGIVMATALVVAIWIANKIFNSKNKNNIDIIVNNSTLFILLSFLGARLYFCILNFSYYFSHPLEILNFRQGGLSIHGAIFVGIISLIYIAHKNKIEPLKLLDAIACTTILGQAIGRWGNYFNSEAYGIPTDQTWGLYIPYSQRISEYSQFSLYHPTFLYESILNLLGFIFLLFIYKKTKRNGVTFFAYLTIYAIIRFFIEQLRIDSALNIRTIPIAQIVSIGLFLTGVIGLIILYKKQSILKNK